MFDHVGLNVRDYAASRSFYEQALAPLGYRVLMAFEQWKTCGLYQPTYYGAFVLDPDGNNVEAVCHGGT
jgi:catechol 2,3-dioxygenase-like lactoylglutathione lyase family enzyme